MNDAIEEMQQVVLTPPQRDALLRLLRQAQQQQRRRAMLQKMEFTPEQKTRMEAILAEARQRAQQAKTPQEKQAILAQAHKTIRRDVWTQKQREQFAMVLMEQYRQRLRSLGLSENQIAQAEKILADAQTQAQSAATVEEKRQVLQDAVETIRRTVLRPDQRERLR